MSDLISRKAVIALAKDIRVPTKDGTTYCHRCIDPCDVLELPSVETGIIHCCDCKWWDRLEEGHPYGYCRACQSGTHTERWEIFIYRQNRYDFYCADAEPKEDDDDDERFD